MQTIATTAAARIGITTNQILFLLPETRVGTGTGDRTHKSYSFMKYVKETGGNLAGEVKIRRL
jgi:hypothetical protein